jgi:hypothetical protein
MKLLPALFVVLTIAAGPLRAWDYEGHRIVNKLAITSLPKDFPIAVNAPATAERIAFLSGEPDRWRNSTNVTFKHAHAQEHYLDVDDLEPLGLTPKTASPFRYDFIAQLKSAREKHPEKFAPIDPGKNSDHTRDLIGMLPWALNEQFAKLQSAFSYLKTFEQFGGTPEEIQNARDNIIYQMGVIGHFAGDAAQPLHTTKHYNGWVGPNPNRYSTNKSIHSWIDGGFIRRAEVKFEQLSPKVRGAKLLSSKGTAVPGVFEDSMAFILEQFALVEKTYQLDRDGKLSPNRGDVTEGKEFIGGQLIKGGQFLGDLWFTAWQSAGVDDFLKRELTRRKNQVEEK